MSFKTHFCKDSPLPKKKKKKCLKTNIDERIYNLGFPWYTENLVFVFIHQYSTSKSCLYKTVKFFFHTYNKSGF